MCSTVLVLVQIRIRIQDTVDTEHSDTLLALFKFGQTPCPVHVGY